MQIETDEPEEIQLNMTAMIDIVFQLLIFFIMTFKVVAMEGDYNIKMPLASAPSDQVDLDEPPELIEVSLRAGGDGNINKILVDDSSSAETFGNDTMFADLTDYIEKKLAAGNDPEKAKDTEVEFEIDYNLKYRHTVSAIEAVSGKVVNGNVKKLIQKIKFKSNPNAG